MQSQRIGMIINHFSVKKIKYYLKTNQIIRIAIETKTTSRVLADVNAPILTIGESANRKIKRG